MGLLFFRDIILTWNWGWDIISQRYFELESWIIQVCNQVESDIDFNTLSQF